ncbi:MAG: hypothetical protein IKT07_03385 [Oscillospiraceae bacterium]|nr:hypothetical protein [Oscillospiraceae bacterium]
MNNKNKDYKAMWSSHHFWIAVVAIAVLYIYPEIKKVNPTLAMIFAGAAVVALIGFFVIKGLRLDIAKWKSGSPTGKKTSAIPEPGSQRSRVREPAAKASSGMRKGLAHRRSAEYPKPDPDRFTPVVQGQDHLERDKTRRIEQLDGWLESGLIDKKEYNELKDRYEHDK